MTAGGIIVVWLERKACTALPFAASVSTEYITDFQGLPPDPDEAVKSNTKESHIPICRGEDITTDGGVTRLGTDNKTLAGELNTSAPQALLHLVFTRLGSNDMTLFTFNLA
jgi:hypothetical protein